MSFNLNDFLKALQISLFRQPFRLRRWFYILLFTLLFLTFLTVVSVLRWMDVLFFPAFRKTEVRQPLFIIAPPRSGTTFLQRVMCQDEDQFHYWKMYQTIFPSICFQKLVDILVWSDIKLGRVFSRFLNWCQMKWFGGWDDLHTMRLNHPEEDGAIYLYAFAAEAIYLLFPFIDELWNVGFHDALPAGKQKKLMTYYRRCLQRQVYCNGNGRTMLIKSTQSCGAVEALKAEFPDARFITIFRNPSEAIASNISLTIPAWQVHSPEITKNGPQAEAYAKLIIAWYKHLFDFCLSIPESDYYSIDYRDLRASPTQTVRSIYKHFGWPMTSEYQTKLVDIEDQNKRFESKHKYTLEEFGLSQTAIETELGPLLQMLQA
ncbi:sulfotransferase family protein [Methylomonas sp. MgM2]